MARKVSFKKERFEELILHASNNFIRTVVSDKRLRLLSFTKVELLPDFSMATLYWDTYQENKRGDCKEGLSAFQSRLRMHLSSVLKVRHTPSLRFFYDGQYVCEKHIEDLLSAEE